MSKEAKCSAALKIWHMKQRLLFFLSYHQCQTMRPFRFKSGAPLSLAYHNRYYGIYRLHYLILAVKGTIKASASTMDSLVLDSTSGLTLGLGSGLKLMTLWIILYVEWNTNLSSSLNSCSAACVWNIIIKPTGNILRRYSIHWNTINIQYINPLR